MAELVKKTHPLKGKGALVGAAVLAVLLALFFWDQKAPPPRDPDSQPPVSNFAHLTSADVTRVQVKRADGGFTLAKQAGKWVFEAPARYRANSDSVDAWLKAALEDSTVNRSLEAKPTDLAAYGLDKPVVEVALTARGGQTRTLQTGSAFKGADSSVFYAREAADGRLFMLSSSQVDDLKNKKVLDLRDKRLIEAPEEKDVQKVTLQRPGGAVEIQRRGDDKWEMVQPYAAPAEKFDVEGLISQLRTAEADRFVENAGSDPAKYGLDQPQLILTVTDKKGRQQVVRFGKRNNEGNLYAARQGDPEITLVSKSTFEGLSKQPADLRDRSLITLEREKVRTLELQNRHGSVRLQKVNDNEWQFADAPDPKAKKAGKEAVERIIDAVRGSARKHVEEEPKDLARYGLDKPVITVTMNDGVGASQVVLVGKKTADGAYFARGAGGAVFTIEPYTYTDLDVARDALKEAPAKK